jgi:thiol-disulfide isomerase/thioredoxin
MNRRLLLASGVGLAAAAAGGGFALLRSRRKLDEAEAAFWALSFEQPGGSILRMQSLRGAPLLLNFWATWCPPCLKEMPLLDRFHREHRARGWQVVGLAVDGPSQVREYLARLPMGFPIGLAGLGGAELSRSLGNVNAALPFTVVFGSQGTVQVRKLGSVSSEDLDGWVRWA